MKKHPAIVVVAALAAWTCVHAEPVADALWLRGFTAIPTPQKVALEAGTVLAGPDWAWQAAGGVKADHIAVRTLAGGLREWHALELKPGTGAGTIVLAVRPGTVATPAGDADVAPQGYRLRIAPGRVEITGNGDAGLFYGVQTLLQLARPGPRGTVELPHAVIDDWPRLPLRFLHWDLKHHQDRMETLKRYLDWAARFKANRIGLELEDKFEYPSLPDIGAPGAFTTAELQELVRYGQERFIQIVPVIQAPAHLSYVLKHPRYAHLRADGNNYQANLCKEESYQLIFRMFDDVIRATPGVDLFFASTDEVYYAAAGEGCAAPDNEDTRSQAWATFARRAHDHLASRGRRMLAWIEYPLLAKHLDQVPSGVIDGVVGEDDYVPIEKRKGMRQLLYVSLQGSEFLFPDHLPLETELRDPKAAGGGDDPLEFERGFSGGRLRSAHAAIAGGRPWQLHPIGVFAAAWDDSGLHNETFWLGWAAAARWGWHPGTPGPEQHAAEFMRVYYGPDAAGMVEIYRTMERQARAWQRTWDRVISRVRGPGYGNSDGKGIGTKRYDQTLEAPPLPRGDDLAFTPRFAAQYGAWLRQNGGRAVENDRLVHAILDNFPRAARNRYNLEVMLGLARFIGHHWRLLAALAEAEEHLGQARAAAARGNAAAADAVGHLVEAHNRAAAVERSGRTAYRDLVEIFEKSQYPKGRAVNGRAFVQVLDDTKDHWAARTADWRYMFAPEESIGLAAWTRDLRAMAAAYAARHKVPLKGLAEARLEE